MIKMMALAIGGIALVGCSSSSTSAPPTTTLPSASALYAKRYCEVLLLEPTGSGAATISVYTSFPMSDCPEAKWKALDAATLAKENGVPLAVLNGPRYWAIDSVIKDFEGKKVTTSFGGITMNKGATVSVDIASIGAPYVPRAVNRTASFTFDAGRQVSELTAPDGSVYLMQSWSQQIDPTLSARDLPGLAAKLTLPEGWSYTTRKLKDAVVIESTSKAAIVLQDDLGNSYSLKTAG